MGNAFIVAGVGCLVGEVNPSMVFHRPFFILFARSVFDSGRDFSHREGYGGDSFLGWRNQGRAERHSKGTRDPSWGDHSNRLDGYYFFPRQCVHGNWVNAKLRGHGDCDFVRYLGHDLCQ